ncbi:MAG: isochorismatase family protein, partial [Bacteroidaceae bacterium]|nr:isochorismatase family protein [Bacteroidaceae bacterium]
NIFVKTKSNALTSEAFSAFIAANGINEFYVAGADATGCVKSTCFNMALVQGKPSWSTDEM